MKKKHLIILDIDDTLTSSEEKHTDSLLYALEHFGITNIDTDWRNYAHATDSHIFKVNYEKTFQKDFNFDLIKEFEMKMVERFLSYEKETTEIKGASLMVDYFLKETPYAICFATGSIKEPAYLKLQQAKIEFIPDLVETSNAIFERENIVKSAIGKAKKYFKVDSFNQIISCGDGLWDVITAKNVNAHFVGINNKNAADFNKMNVPYFVEDWAHFNLRYVEELFNIQ